MTVEWECGHFSACQGRIVMGQLLEPTGICVWIGPDDETCQATVFCANDYWWLEISHGPTGKRCIYRKSASQSSCPDGHYTRTSGDCDDCPSTMTVDEV